MLGDVWQWTQDCWHDGYGGAPGDGSAWTSGECNTRVVRGSSWLHALRRVRAALRGGGPPVIRFGSTGFRVAKTLQ